jgi:hypothetical protein
VVLGCLIQGGISYFADAALTLYGWPFHAYSAISILCNSPKGSQPLPTRSHNPSAATLASLHDTGLGSFPFARRYLGNHYCFLFLRVLRCFNSPRLPLTAYVFSGGCRGMTPGGFPHSEIPGSKLVWQLPEAYRSHPRLSSPPDAKASTVCP